MDKETRDYLYSMSNVNYPPLEKGIKLEEEYVEQERIKLGQCKDYREAKTDKESYSLTEIPLESLVRLGRVFQEGHEKYGRGNWRNGVGDIEYQLERCNHAIKHLMVYAQWLESGQRVGLEEEDDLAKVMWFCATQIELERLEIERNG